MWRHDICKLNCSAPRHISVNFMDTGLGNFVIYFFFSTQYVNCSRQFCTFEALYCCYSKKKFHIHGDFTEYAGFSEIRWSRISGRLMVIIFKFLVAD